MIQFIAQIFLLVSVVYSALKFWNRGQDVNFLRSIAPQAKDLPDDALRLCFAISGVLGTLAWLLIYYAAGAFSKILEL